MQLAQREPYVIEWAKGKGLIQHTTEQALAQNGKTDEEVGELLEAIAIYEERHTELQQSEDPDSTMAAQQAMDLAKKEIALEAGDVLVTLIIQCAIQKQSLGYAIEAFDYVLQSSTMAPMGLSELSRRLRLAINGEAKPWLFAFAGRLINEVRKEIQPYGLTLDECLEAAWHKIKGRKGKTVDGVFVKESV